MSLPKPELDRLLGKAIDDAARDLPEGWRLRIDVEAGSASVELWSPAGLLYEFELDPDGMHRTVDEAVQAAVRLKDGGRCDDDH